MLNFKTVSQRQPRRLIFQPSFSDVHKSVGRCNSEDKINRRGRRFELGLNSPEISLEAILIGRV